MKLVSQRRLLWPGDVALKSWWPRHEDMVCSPALSRPQASEKIAAPPPTTAGATSGRGASALALAGAIAAVCPSSGSRSQPRAQKLGAATPTPLRRAATADPETTASDEDEDFDYGAGKDYWDNRYKKEEGKNFDWLGDYEKFREFIESATASLDGGPRSAKVLDLGCGNAKLGEEMYDDGFENITALDISEVAIESMRQRNSETRPRIDWVVGDAFDLQLEDQSFDLVIDKSTTDAVSCDADHIHENMTRMYGEVFRVLKPGGTFLVFSSVVDVPQAALQLPHLSFDVTEKEIYRPFSKLFAFSARKCAEAPRASTEEALQQSRVVDQRMVQERQRLKMARDAQVAADERLKETAPSSFGVLD
eukprot:s3771_g2.t1